VGLTSQRVRAATQCLCEYTPSGCECTSLSMTSSRYAACSLALMNSWVCREQDGDMASLPKNSVPSQQTKLAWPHSLCLPARRCLITLHGDLAVFNIYAPAVCSTTTAPASAPASTPSAAPSAVAVAVAAPAAAAAAAPVPAGARVELKLAFLTAVEMRARALRRR
jgi:hypothetical protein